MKRFVLSKQDLFGVRPPGRITAQAQMKIAEGIEKVRSVAEIDDGFWNEEESAKPAPVTHLVQNGVALTEEGQRYV